jgi:hypothetical protein
MDAVETATKNSHQLLEEYLKSQATFDKFISQLVETIELNSQGEQWCQEQEISPIQLKTIILADKLSIQHTRLMSYMLSLNPSPPTYDLVDKLAKVFNFSPAQFNRLVKKLQLVKPIGYELEQPMTIIRDLEALQLRRIKEDPPLVPAEQPKPKSEQRLQKAQKAEAKAELIDQFKSGLINTCTLYSGILGPRYPKIELLARKIGVRAHEMWLLLEYPAYQPNEVVLNKLARYVRVTASQLRAAHQRQADSANRSA